MIACWVFELWQLLCESTAARWREDPPHANNPRLCYLVVVYFSDAVLWSASSLEQSEETEYIIQSDVKVWFALSTAALCSIWFDVFVCQVCCLLWFLIFFYIAKIRFIFLILNSSSNVLISRFLCFYPWAWSISGRLRFSSLKSSRSHSVSCRLTRE